MILLPLLALLPLLHSSQADSCPADAACLQYTLCTRRAPVENPPEQNENIPDQNENGVEGDPDENPSDEDDDGTLDKKRRAVREAATVEKVQFVESNKKYGDGSGCSPLDRTDTVRMEFRLPSPTVLSVRFTSSETNINNLLDIPFEVNVRSLRFEASRESDVYITGVGSATYTIESSPGEPIAGHFTVECFEGVRLAFCYKRLSGRSEEQGRLPKFPKKLKELTPCSGYYLKNASAMPDYQPVFKDAGRTVVCTGADKKLWIKGDEKSGWTAVNELVCKDTEWSTNGQPLKYEDYNPKAKALMCNETNPWRVGETNCTEKISKACVDRANCDISITPSRATCSSKLQINNGPRAPHNWEDASEIICIDDKWHWLPSPDGELKPLEDRKISCHVEPESAGLVISPLAMLIGGWIGAVVVIFLAIGFCVVFVKISTRKPKNHPKTETSQGVPPSSQAAVPPPQPQ